MPTQRVRPPSQEIIDKIPSLIKKELSEDSIIQLASSMQDYMKDNIVPATGELTYSGSQRITGYNSTFNIYNSLGLYNSSDVPLNVLDTMRRDYQIALGMSIVKYPIAGLTYTVECKNPIIKTFIETVITPIWSKMISDMLMSFDYGFSAFEKVWENQVLDLDPGLNQRKVKGRNFIILSKLKPVSPKTLSLRLDELGNFIGIQQDQNMPTAVKLNRNKCLLVTYQEEYGNYFGKSRMIPAYESWYWKMVSVQFFLRWMERHSISPYKVLFPKGKTITSSNGEVSNAEVALMMAKAVSAYGNVTLPSDRDDNGHPRWDIVNIEQSKQNLTLDKIINVWDMGILCGLLLPMGISAQSSGTGGIDVETSTKVFLSTLAGQVLNMETIINKEIIQPLIYWNFPPEERDECELNIEDIDFQKREEMRKLYSKILDVSATFLKQSGGLPYKTMPDVDRILEILNIPSVPVTINVPDTIDADGKEVKPVKPKQSTGPDKGEPTSGNQSRIDRGGNGPRNEDNNPE